MPVRAKRSLAAIRGQFEVVAHGELAARLTSAIKRIYLILTKATPQHRTGATHCAKTRCALAANRISAMPSTSKRVLF